jgi:catechol 2,3-dioxygenase-like lactoylglutathione lyase family enzyme
MTVNMSSPILANATMVGINLMVSDVERSSAFYSEFLGAPPINDGEWRGAFDVGQCALWLKPRGGPTPAARDRTAMMTFMVPNIDEASAALRSRGVEVGEIARYEVGATAEFRDPDGHSLALYEPSTPAMSWPSGGKIASIVNGRVSPTLVYIFLFVPDAEAAYSFYHHELGLPYLECRACRRGSSNHEQGVVKYDVGSLMLTTHLVEGADDSELGRAARDPHILSELVPVFTTSKLGAVSAALKQRKIGAIKRGQPKARELAFTDQFGRPFLVRETSAALGPSPQDDGSALSAVSR